ncbi:MAG: carbamoyl-phosphate synthase large subunit [Firmicutes bacterium]|nr:carbamoyl-phosphate synthase large subunit [Bacillota bacterium]
MKKVLVIGSGPIVIGQAAEFDYSGTQACRSLREEGIEVVLVNSNPATIMTDPEQADRVYVEPLDLDSLAAIIARERPEGLLPTLGGQVGLNLAVALAEAGVLDRYGVALLGTPLEAIRRAEDRKAFKETMQAIGEPVPASAIVTNLAEAEAFAAECGFPLVVRPAYTLGGTGGGFVTDREELVAVVTRGLRQSPIRQVLLEQSVAGWKEIEYEVMRDADGNCITVCNMENLDPVGVHTGDSIVVAPSQTLSDREYQRLRTASIRIISALGIQGGCNIQFALDPKSERYFVIEVNPRVSRSSALASKATGYPIAKVAAKIAIGRRLDEIKNAVTGQTFASFEPALDYVVVKIPRWPFDKFALADRRLGTQMKATGEVMAIGRTFPAALQKAIRSLENGFYGLRHPKMATWRDEELVEFLRRPGDEWVFAVAEGLRRGFSLQMLNELTAVDPYFLAEIRRIVHYERTLAEAPSLTGELLAVAKELGFADREIAALRGEKEAEVRAARQREGIVPGYRMVDTCAAEFEAQTPYFYSSYGEEDEARPGRGRRAVVIGAGPIRIGQGIEFDYCSVHAVWALREAGYEAVIVNNNPETVSTDFDTADRLYFEPLTFEDVMAVIEKEKPEGVVVQFGGQTAINLAGPLAAAGVPILGTSVEGIDLAEDRERFDRLLAELGIPRPPGGIAGNVEEALDIAARIGYPVLVRPSYVLGGRAMEIVYHPEELVHYADVAARVSPEHPLLVDKYVQGRECEVDAIADGEDVLVPGIMEHVERAGIHSGDSFAVYPPVNLTRAEKERILVYTTRLARALDVRGLVNIQFVVADGTVYVIEVNPRASRTVPFLSKVTGVPMVRVAMRAVLGESLRKQGYEPGLYPERPFWAVKAPVFSFGKLTGVEVSLGPEMKSTGEAMGMAPTYGEALAKAFRAAGIGVRRGGTALVTIADRDKPDALPLVAGLARAGFHLVATTGTALFLIENGLAVEPVYKLGEGKPDVIDLLRSGRIDMVCNTLPRGREPERDGFRIRRAAVEVGIPCLTSLDTLQAYLNALESPVEASAPIALQDLDAVRGVQAIEG